MNPSRTAYASYTYCCKIAHAQKMPGTWEGM